MSATAALAQHNPTEAQKKEAALGVAAQNDTIVQFTFKIAASSKERIVNGNFYLKYNTTYDFIS